ncbi:MAG: hypothetical protein K2X47_18040 [Bdellovibrionales bacterium]|nr:hypothetical protein [Bdellovibrionales bacterium]
MDLGMFNYHFRARRMQRLWNPFRQVVSSILEPALFEERSVVLVGPSLGYIVPLEIFRGARSVVAFDRDPIVRLFLKARLGRFRADDKGTTTKVIRQAIHTPRGLQEFSELAGRGSWFVFCNVLGQLKYSWLDGVPEEATENELKARMDLAQQWFSSLSQILQNEKWISFHDRISFDDLAPISGDLAKGFLSQNRLSEDAVFQKHVELTNSNSTKSFESHWLDFWKIDEGPFFYAPWKITPQRTQWIEFSGSKDVRVLLSAKGPEITRQAGESPLEN